MTSHAGYSPADVLSAVAAVSSRELNIVHRINDYSTVAALVAAGGVIGLLPRYTAGPVLNPDIVLRPLQGSAPGAGSTCWRGRKTSSADR